MNKNDLINGIAQHFPFIPKSKISSAVSAIISTISEALSKGEKVTLSGFGTFYVGQRRARKGTNPRTKEIITIPAASVPKFKAGSGLKKLVK